MIIPKTMSVVVVRSAGDRKCYLRSFIPGATQLFTLAGDVIEFTIKNISRKMNSGEKEILRLQLRQKVQDQRLGEIFDLEEILKN